MISLSSDRKIKNNIRLLFLLAFAWNFLVIQAIMVPFYFSKGLNQEQIISISTVFSLTLLLFDLPTGYLADRFSRKKAIILAGFLKGLGGTVLLYFQSYLGFISAFVLIGLGNSLLSGADIGLLTHLNLARGAAAQPMRRLLATRLAIALAGGALSAILAGVLGRHSFQLPLILNCIFAWFSFLLALFLHEPLASDHLKKRAQPNFSSFARALFGSNHELRSILINRIGLLAILQIHMSILQIMWQSFSVPIIWFGFLSAFHGLLGAGLSMLVGRSESVIGKRKLQGLSVLIPVIAFMGLGFGRFCVPLGLVAGLTMEVLRALVGGQLNARYNEVLPVNLLATGNSCASMGARLIFVIISPVIGYGLQHYGASSTALALASIVLVCSLPQLLRPVSEY